MGYSARKTAARPIRADQGGYPSDPHDAIEMEFLGLWLGMARLREQVLGHCVPRTERVGVRAGKPSASRKPRRKAA